MLVTLAVKVLISTKVKYENQVTEKYISFHSQRIILPKIKQILLKLLKIL